MHGKQAERRAEHEESELTSEISLVLLQRQFSTECYEAEIELIAFRDWADCDEELLRLEDIQPQDRNAEYNQRTLALYTSLIEKWFDTTTPGAINGGEKNSRIESERLMYEAEHPQNKQDSSSISMFAITWKTTLHRSLKTLRTMLRNMPTGTYISNKSHLCNIQAHSQAFSDWVITSKDTAPVVDLLGTTITREKGADVVVKNDAERNFHKRCQTSWFKYSVFLEPVAKRYGSDRDKKRMALTTSVASKGNTVDIYLKHKVEHEWIPALINCPQTVLRGSGNMQLVCIQIFLFYF